MARKKRKKATHRRKKGTHYKKRRTPKWSAAHRRAYKAEKRALIRKYNSKA